MAYTEADIANKEQRLAELRAKIPMVQQAIANLKAQKSEHATLSERTAQATPEQGLVNANLLVGVQPPAPPEATDRTRTTMDLIGDVARGMQIGPVGAMPGMPELGAGLTAAMQPPEQDVTGIGDPAFWGNAAKAVAQFVPGFVELPRKLLSLSIQDKLDAVHELEAMVPLIGKEGLQPGESGSDFTRKQLGELLGPIYDALAAPLGDDQAWERLKQSGGVGPTLSAIILASPFAHKGAKAIAQRRTLTAEANRAMPEVKQVRTVNFLRDVESDMAEQGNRVAYDASQARRETFKAEPAKPSDQIAAQNKAFAEGGPVRKYTPEDAWEAIRAEQYDHPALYEYPNIKLKGMAEVKAEVEGASAVPKAVSAVKAEGQKAPAPPSPKSQPVSAKVGRGDIPKRPEVNPHASAIAQDKQILAQQKWDREYGHLPPPELPKATKAKAEPPTDLAIQRRQALVESQKAERNAGRREVIENRIRLGLDVPQKVLNEFPDLAPPKPASGATVIAPETKPKIAPRAIELTEAPTTVPVKEAKFAQEGTRPPTPREKSISDKTVSLRKEDGAATRKRLGLDKLEPPKRQSFEDAWDQATESGAAEHAIDVAREAVENKRPLTPEEHAGAVQKYLRLEDELKQSRKSMADAIKAGNDDAVPIEMARTMRVLDEIDALTRATNATGTEAGRALSVRRLRADTETFDVAHVLQLARAKKGSKLTPAEIAGHEQRVAQLTELEGKHEKLRQENERLVEERDKLKATHVAQIEVQRAKVQRRTTDLREKIQSERADIQKQLTALGYKVNDITGATAEGSYLAGKLAVNYIKEAVEAGKGKVELDAIVKQVIKDIPELTARDVYDALNAKSPERVARARTRTQKAVTEIKKQARIAAEIDDIANGLAKTNKTPAGRRLTESKAVQGLRKKLTEARSQLYKTDIPADRLERALSRLNRLQDQLANHYRDVKKTAKGEAPPELADIQAEIKKLTREMRSEDVLADLNEQVRTGDYKLPQKREPGYVSPQFERNQIEIRRQRRVIRDALERQSPMTAHRAIGGAGDLLRSQRATADLSATLRQGFILSARRAFRDPVGLGRDFRRSLEATFKKYTDEQIDNAIHSDPRYYLTQQAKLELAEKGGKATGREEMLRSQLAERIPVWGEVVQASERHMRTFLNLMRQEAFYKYLDSSPNATVAEMKAMANAINVFSGRGDLGRAAAVANELGTVVFAPRFSASRIQTPYMIFKHWKEPRVRKEIAKTYAATAAVGGGLLTLMHLNGAEVGIDPRESDWGKGRFGNTRFDVWAGVQQPMRVVSRIILGGVDREDDVDPLALLGQFTAYKLAPLATMPLEIYRGKTMVGEERTPTETAVRALWPMVAEDIADAYKSDKGMVLPVASAVILGIGANTYEDSQSKTRRRIRKLQDDGKTTEALRLKQEWNRAHPDKRIVNVN